MPLFYKRKDVAAQNFVLRLVNNNCPGLVSTIEGPRTDSRVNLVVVVTILPFAHKRLQMDQAFTAVTKEFSATGVGVVLDRRRTLDEALLGFRLDGEMTFLHSRAIHLDPMGGGFYQIGFQLITVASVHDYPELKSLQF